MHTVCTRNKLRANKNDMRQFGLRVMLAHWHCWGKWAVSKHDVSVTRSAGLISGPQQPLPKVRTGPTFALARFYRFTTCCHSSQLLAKKTRSASFWVLYDSCLVNSAFGID